MVGIVVKGRENNLRMVDNDEIGGLLVDNDEIGVDNDEIGVTFMRKCRPLSQNNKNENKNESLSTSPKCTEVAEMRSDLGVLWSITEKSG